MYKNKVVLAHSGFAHVKSNKEFRENSIEACRESAASDYIDIIELDVRKSKDGILCCYHGNMWEYFVALKIPINFSLLQKRYNVDTLENILDVIPESKSIFLDIKNTGITRDDILSTFKDRMYKEVILGNKSVRYLSRFTEMPSGFVKILNGNVFCNFYNLRKLKVKGFKYFEAVFPFQVNTKTFKKVLNSGLMFRISGIGFFSKKSYWNKINKYNITHISSDFIDIS